MKNQDRIWSRISSEADWLDLDRLVFGFHDGVIKELRWSHGEYVNPGLEMVYAGSASVWVLIQLQSEEVPVVELRFHDVRECSVSASRELEASVTFSDGFIIFAFSSDGVARIVAEKCEYRLSGNQMLGPNPPNIPD